MNIVKFNDSFIYMQGFLSFFFLSEILLLKARKKKKEMLIPKSITLKTYSLSVLTGR